MNVIERTLTLKAPLAKVWNAVGTPGGFDIRGLPDLSSFTKDPIGAAFKTASADSATDDGRQ